MQITFQQLIALLPILIIVFTIITIMLCISWRRNYFINFILTIVGINLSLLSMWFVGKNIPIDVTSLIRVDNFSLFYSGLILIVVLIISILSYSWLFNFVGNRDEFYLLILIATIGGILLSSTNHLVTLFIGIELISLPILGMINFGFYQKYSLEASIKYLFLSAVSSSFLLFGMSFWYACIGKLSFIDISQIINNSIFDRSIFLVGLGMIVVGIGFKLSLVPFHSWTPDVYQGSPVLVSAFLSTVSKISIFSAIMRLFLYIPLTTNESIKTVLIIISFISILFGNFMALNQTNIKRTLGYSSIAHQGYILSSLISIQSYDLAFETVGIYLIGYLFANIGIFSVMNFISNSYNIINKNKDIDSLYFYRGLFWYHPFLSFILTVMMLSLSGIPITLGFIGKFYIIFLCISNNLKWLIFAIIIGSIVSTFYYMRIIINLYLFPKRKINNSSPYNLLINISNIIIFIFSLLIIILFGIYPKPIITLLKIAKPIF